MEATSDARLEKLTRRVVASGIVAALAYFVFSVLVGWQDVVASIERIGPAGIVVALALSALNYGLRFVRWQMYLRVLGHPIANAPSALIYLSGFAFTTTPGKAGELLRGVFLHRRGTPFVKSAAAFLNERLSDLIAILLLTMPGLMLVPSQAARLIVAATLGMFCGLYLVVRSGLLPRIAASCTGRTDRIGAAVRYAQLLLTEAKSCYTPTFLAKATSLSILAWGAEAIAFALLLHLLGIAIPVSVAIFIYSAAMLAGALSFLPGGLGGAEATMIGLLAFCGAPNAESVAATIVIRLTTLWFAIAIGILVTFAGRRTLLTPAGSAP